MTIDILNQLTKISKPNKYMSWYISIINHCMSTEYPDHVYCEKHHILPKSFKRIISEDLLLSKDNIVKLPARYHFVAHILLTKMFIDGLLNQKMNYALFQMKAKNKHQNDRYVNSKYYDLIKRETGRYFRFYSNDKVVYVNKLDDKHYDEMVKSGLSQTMTEEYKKGRVGNMKGRKHTAETKLKMGVSSKAIPKPWLSGRIVSDESIKKGKETKLLRELEDPDVYKESRRITSEKLKLKYITGELSVKGDKNPRYGIKLSDETKKRQSEKMERNSNNGYTHLEICRNIFIPALEKSPMIVSDILKLSNCKWRPHYLRKLIKEADPDFNLDRIKRNPTIRTDEHSKTHAELLQRKYNNGYTYEEIYNYYIFPTLSDESNVDELMSNNKLSMKSLKEIIERFHLDGKQLWKTLMWRKRYT